jgi:hypothetical protein
MLFIGGTSRNHPAVAKAALGFAVIGTDKSVPFQSRKIARTARYCEFFSKV